MIEAIRTDASIELPFSSSREAKVIHDSLKPEELLPKTTRTEVDIKRGKNILYLEINAKDTAALRAAINSFLRWAIVARDMIKV